MNALLTCDGGVTGSVRNWLRVEGLAAFTLSVLLYWHSGTSWWMFLGLLLMADALAQTPALQMNAIYECRVPLSLKILSCAGTNANDIG
jgi:hypothetical protein